MPIIAACAALIGGSGISRIAERTLQTPFQALPPTYMVANGGKWCRSLAVVQLLLKQLCP
jgi:hypothetical protein